MPCYSLNSSLVLVMFVIFLSSLNSSLSTVDDKSLATFFDFDYSHEWKLIDQFIILYASVPAYELDMFIVKYNYKTILGTDNENRKQ